MGITVDDDLAAVDLDWVEQPSGKPSGPGAVVEGPPSAPTQADTGAGFLRRNDINGSLPDDGPADLCALPRRRVVSASAHSADANPGGRSSTGPGSARNTAIAGGRGSRHRRAWPGAACSPAQVGHWVTAHCRRPGTGSSGSTRWTSMRNSGRTTAISFSSLAARQSTPCWSGRSASPSNHGRQALIVFGDFSMDARYDRNRSTVGRYRYRVLTEHSPTQTLPASAPAAPSSLYLRCVLDNGNPVNADPGDFQCTSPVTKRSQFSYRGNVSPFLGQRRLAGNRVGRL